MAFTTGNLSQRTTIYLQLINSTRYLLLAAASTMGSVSIWSMHYIGNQAVIMEPRGLYINYSPGFTAGSFFLPIFGVAIAFYFISITERVSILGTLLGGFLAGSAICGYVWSSNLCSGTDLASECTTWAMAVSPISHYSTLGDLSSDRLSSP